MLRLVLLLLSVDCSPLLGGEVAEMVVVVLVDVVEVELDDEVVVVLVLVLDVELDAISAA
jgi:hypothetical protein